ncbi:uncharacterized protein LOC125945894 [Dermacentor silvarum]|uniref:uncharacterized protein LOC125945894 n=1 Tax=Dermacentor silvarum TaxID=543639 RepID=UPI0021019CCF|nr:uncharacterized protein LOC125945894 [Dermacentor silvarum]
MPGLNCAIKSCRRRSKTDIGISFHTVPVNRGRKKEWDNAVGFTIPPYGRVCSDHFRASDYTQFGSLKSSLRHRLRITAVPSIGLDNSGGTRACVATMHLQGSDEAAPSILSCDVGVYSEVLDDSVVQSGCVSVDVGANMDVDTCCSTLHDPELMECDDHNYASKYVPSPTHGPTPRYASTGTQCRIDTRSCSTQTDSSVCCANCSLCSGDGNHPGLLFAPRSASTPSRKSYADDCNMCGPATPVSGPTTPVNDPKDTSYHPMSDDSMHLDGTTLQTEKKYIVFESCLWELLSACTKCGESCSITKHTQGSSLTVKATCPLGHQKVWSSQPTTNGMAAGNVLLAGAILFSGASAVKVLRLLASVNIEAFTTSTYNVYQKGCLVPAITKVWSTQQASLVEACKGRDLCLLGDGRCDSPGHSAKYLTYTLMDAETRKVLNFTQVQVGQNPQVKTSPQMEKVGFVQCLGELHSKDLKVSTVTTDRHPGIRKHIREKEPGIKHELDSWHVVKGLRKKLEGIAKRAGCTILNGWIQSICNHLYFSVAMSEGNVALRISIWKSLTRHIVNIHSGHEGPYHRCLHDQLSHKEWLDPGSAVYKNLCGMVLNIRLIKDIAQLSADAQTSCLESFHSLMIRFAPKSVAYSPTLMSARTMLAVLHHNANTTRKQACGIDGKPAFRRKMLKTKKGNEVVCPVKESVTYDYVQELLEATVEECSSGSFRSMRESRTTPGPPPMSAAYARLPKHALVAKRMLRFKT